MSLEERDEELARDSKGDIVQVFFPCFWSTSAVLVISLRDSFGSKCLSELTAEALHDANERLWISTMLFCEAFTIWFWLDAAWGISEGISYELAACDGIDSELLDWSRTMTFFLSVLLGATSGRSWSLTCLLAPPPPWEVGDPWATSWVCWVPWVVVDGLVGGMTFLRAYSWINFYPLSGVLDLDFLGLFLGLWDGFCFCEKGSLFCGVELEVFFSSSKNEMSLL